MSTIKTGKTRIEIPEGSGMDLHICGHCHLYFTSIREFVDHKAKECSSSSSTATTGATASQQVSAIAQNLSTQSGKKIQESNQQLDIGGSQSSNTASGHEAASSGIALLHSKSGKLIPSQPPNIHDTPETNPQWNTPISEKRYMCRNDGCSFTTAHLKDMKRHILIHTGEKPYPCRYCEKKFSRQDKLTIHHRIHTGHKPFKCDQCDYACVDGGSLKKHKRIHGDERPFKCQICEYRSRNSSQLTVHLRTHTGDTPFHCQQCKAKFKINSDLTRHMRIHTGHKPYHCKQCDYKASLKSNLNHHIKTNHENEKRFQCDECGFACCTKNQLRQHAIKHATTKPIKCLECNFQCFNKIVFRRHERKHSDERPYKCKYCDFDSKYPGHVPAHIKKRHPDVYMSRPNRKGIQSNPTSTNPEGGALHIVANLKKPFQCDKCNASFMRQDSLLSHKRQHDRVNHEKTQSAISDRESIAYTVLQLQQLQQYSDKNQSQPNASVGFVAEGRTVKSNNVAHLNTVESANQASNQPDSVTFCLANPVDSQPSSTEENYQEEIIEVQFSSVSDALSEVEVSSDNPKEDGPNGKESSHNSVMIVQTDSTSDATNSSQQTITLEFQEEQNIVLALPSTSMSNTQQTSEEVSVAIVHSPSKAIGHGAKKDVQFFQLPVPASSEGTDGVRQDQPTMVQSNIIGQTISVPPNLFNVMQSQLVHTSQQSSTQMTSSKVQVLPAQTTARQAGIGEFAQSALAMSDQILVQSQQQMMGSMEGLQRAQGGTQVTHQHTLVRKPGEQQLTSAPIVTFPTTSSQQQQHMKQISQSRPPLTHVVQQVRQTQPSLQQHAETLLQQVTEPSVSAVPSISHQQPSTLLPSTQIQGNAAVSAGQENLQ